MRYNVLKKIVKCKILFILSLIGISTNFIFAGQTYKKISNKLSNKLQLYSISITNIEPPSIIDDDIDYNNPKYIECIIEYIDSSNTINIESWLFNINAIVENMVENHPNFLRFLYLNKYILGRTKSIACTGWNKLLDGNCIECIKLLAGNVYGSGLLIPILNNDKKQLSTNECMQINDNSSFYLANDINMNTFCKTRIF